ncbi:transcription factor bHLH154-like [Zingiber officinale]|uniref:transcription factor bHLH154-like n=1 Tax=Zingiber officinale TaxID=94328 RepID=UPI001C4D3D3F|nr:transcription factor bHLH154-like [Zingiber officinale]
MDDESFMDMLRSGDEEDYIFSPTSCLSSSSSSFYSSAMLCFGVKQEETVAVVRGASQKSTDSSLSSLSSSPPSTIITRSQSPTKETANRGRRRLPASSTKKPKTVASAGPSGTIMVRKEKLGERIMALQQLVSPFGKSDTASVLHEAQGYIRFLHDQVQVLSSPYLQGLPSYAHLHGGGRGSDLRSRGLCLVPVSDTEHVASSNDADLWSLAVGNNRGSSDAKH